MNEIEIKIKETLFILTERQMNLTKKIIDYKKKYNFCESKNLKEQLICLTETINEIETILFSINKFLKK